MELKHFSHIHGLVFHHVPQGSQVHCSACKSPGSGNVYACWQCNYFLHEQCFHATRSLNHPSHPLHPLTLALSPTYPSGSFWCNSCNLDGHGLSYSCSACDFDIHVHCALIPNPNPHASPAPSFSPHNYNSQPQISTYPPPSHIATTTSNDTQHYPPQTSVYPSVPNNPFPIVNPVYQQPNITTPPPPQPTPFQSNNPKSETPMTQHYPPQTSINPSVPNNPVFPQPNIATPQPTHVIQRNNPKSVKSVAQHFSHPHFLKLKEFDQKNEEVCSACDSHLSGSAYTCPKPQCSFNLHKACFDSTREVRHEFHPHPLTLLSAPSSAYGDVYTCDACQKVGTAFVYNCATCGYDLHMDCFWLPETVTRPDHDHPLNLSTPVFDNFMCDVCKILVNENAWVYYCSQCDFGTHLECVHSKIEQENVSEQEEEEEAEIEQNVSEEEEEAEIEQNVSEEEEEDEEEEEAEIEQNVSEEDEDEDDEEEAEIEQNVSEEEEDEDDEEEAEIEQNVSEEDEEEEKEEDDDNDEDEDEETGDIAERLFKLQQQRMHSEIRLQMAQQNAQFVNSIANSWRNIM